MKKKLIFIINNIIIHKQEMAKLFTTELKCISANEFQSINKTYHNNLIGKHESIYRVSLLKENMGIDLFSKKTKGEVIDGSDLYESRLTVYCKKTAFDSVEHVFIKEAKYYFIFAIYLAINYVRGVKTIKKFVDDRYASCKAKYDYTNEKFGLMRNTIQPASYDFFEKSDEDCCNKFQASIDKLLKDAKVEPVEIPQDVHDKCIRVAFKDALCAYSYEKASTFGFTIQQQRLQYLGCDGEDVQNDFNELYKSVITVCAPSAKRTTSTSSATKGATKSKGKAKKAATNIEVEADDDCEIEDEDENENDI